MIHVGEDFNRDCYDIIIIIIIINITMASSN